MYKVFYEEIRSNIPSASVCMSDTDSWILKLPGKTVEDAIQPISHIFDFSNIPSSHPWFTEAKKAQVIKNVLLIFTHT